MHISKSPSENLTLKTLLDKKWDDIVKSWKDYEANVLGGFHPVTKRSLFQPFQQAKRADYFALRDKDAFSPFSGM